MVILPSPFVGLREILKQYLKRILYKFDGVEIDLDLFYFIIHTSSWYDGFFESKGFGFS